MTMNVQVDNSSLDDEEAYSGVDDILLGLDGGSSSAQQRQEFQEFYDAQLPNMKEESPGLKMSQYKDEGFQLWRRRVELANSTCIISTSIYSMDDDIGNMTENMAHCIETSIEYYNIVCLFHYHANNLLAISWSSS